MSDKVLLKWSDNFCFEGNVNGHKVILDADVTNGGKDSGPRPKALMLLALAGCTAMDVVSILNKMRMPYEGFQVEVESDKTHEHPIVYKGFKIVYRFKGKKLDVDKINNAISLSQDKYCGVSAMYQRIAPVTYEVILEE